MLLTLLILWPAQAGSQPPKPVRIGVSLGLTGKYAPMAQNQLHAFRLWERQVNERGGLLGRPVELTVVDDRSSSATALTIYRRFIEEERMELLFAPYSSEITLAVLPLTEQHRYPLLASGAAADEIWQRGYRYIFGIFTPAGNISFSFLEMLVSLGIDNLAVFHSDDPFSRQAAAGMLKWARRLGLQIDLVELFERERPDYQAMLQRARKAEVQVVMMSGHLPEAVGLRRAMLEAGWQPRIYYATQGPGNEAFVQQLGEAADGVFGTEQWQYLGGAPREICADFVTAYQELHREPPSYFAASAYSAGRIMERAVTLAGSLEGEKLRAILAQLDFHCLTGRFRVDATGRQIRNFTIVTQRHNLNLEVVWPRSLMTREPRL
ncbi:amino acid ABC transporter substrate-binding protein [Desulfurivibrio sp. D14AmB]|uniref:amino acid ABC transporter substrate-binding protein n=1 Tax=Desulfurivibrio sp. D14AmB TaxID=3374370 RepID=UPI00376EFB9A